MDATREEEACASMQLHVAVDVATMTIVAMQSTGTASRLPLSLVPSLTQQALEAAQVAVPTAYTRACTDCMDNHPQHNDHTDHSHANMLFLQPLFQIQ
jgi:alkylhydroperoxidase family enzyme